jgi:hypothetical protein
VIDTSRYTGWLILRRSPLDLPRAGVCGSLPACQASTVPFPGPPFTQRRSSGSFPALPASSGISHPGLTLPFHLKNNGLRYLCFCQTSSSNQPMQGRIWANLNQSYFNPRSYTVHPVSPRYRQAEHGLFQGRAARDHGNGNDDQDVEGHFAGDRVELHKERGNEAGRRRDRARVVAIHSHLAATGTARLPCPSR